MRFSIASKLNISLSLVTLLISGLGGISLFFYQVDHQKTLLHERAGMIIRNLAYNSEYGVLVNNTEELDKLLAGVIREKDIQLVRVISDDGTVLSQIHAAGDDNQPIIRFEHDIVSTPITSSYDDPDSFVEISQSEDSTITEKIGRVELGVSLASYEKEITKTTQLIIGSIILLLSVNLILSYCGINFFINKPLKKLIKEIKIIGSGKLSHRILFARDDEVGDVGVSFNQMTHKLSETLVSKSYLDNILMSMMDMLLVVDENYNISMVNRATQTLLGYDKEELIGKDLFSIFADDLDHQETIHGSIPYNFKKGGESIFLSKDRKHIPIFFSISSLVENENLVGLVCVARDITETIRARNELTQAFDDLKSTQEELLKAERFAVLGETSGRVAHEVLNPITSIYARIEHNMRNWGEFHELLANMDEILTDWFENYQTGNLGQYLASHDEDGKRYGDEDFELLQELIKNGINFKEQRSDDLFFIFKQIQRVIKIINTLRESARMSRTITAVDLIKVIDESIEILDDTLKKRQIDVRREGAEKIPKVFADENEMVQVFTNLLRNCMQAIEIKNQNNGLVVLEVSSNAEQITIFIRDNGIGISADTWDSIFDFNFTTKSPEEGTGLGLGISRRFIREYGGDLFLENSQVNQGTTFCITMPIKQQVNSGGIIA